MNYKFQAYIVRLQTHDWYYDNSNEENGPKNDTQEAKQNF